ncbi:MAG TPA: DUF2914 domain-containing protein [bacterium]|nr:DUF2914 domain-containing protein [bacterium]
MHWRRLSLIAVFVVLAVSLGQAEECRCQALGDSLTDWMNIPTFTVEATLGSGVTTDGQLTGEASSFAKNVGVVYCRVAIIDAAQAQTVTVVWYRGDAETSRTDLQLSKEKHHAITQLTIPAKQAGTWRVEIVDANDNVLTVLPFVVGKASLPTETQHKQKTKQP